MSLTASAAGRRAGGGALPAKSPLTAVLLCWIAVLLDGFDMVVLGVVLPAMMEDPQLQLTAAEGTQISTAGLFGMMLGALAIGRLTDAVGRRWVIIGSVFSFSVLTLFLDRKSGV